MFLRVIANDIFFFLNIWKHTIILQHVCWAVMYGDRESQFCHRVMIKRHKQQHNYFYKVWTIPHIIVETKVSLTVGVINFGWFFSFIWHTHFSFIISDSELLLYTRIVRRRAHCSGTRTVVWLGVNYYIRRPYYQSTYYCCFYIVYVKKMEFLEGSKVRAYDFS